MAQVVEHLPSKCQAQSSDSSTVPQKRKEKIMLKYRKPRKKLKNSEDGKYNNK
jgi:hypothetical protein